MVKHQIEYYQTLLDNAPQAIKAGQSEDQFVKNNKLPQYRHWGNYDRWFTLNVSASYRWVKQRELQ